MRKVFHADVSYWKQPLTFSPSLAVKKIQLLFSFMLQIFDFIPLCRGQHRDYCCVSVRGADCGHVSSAEAVQSVWRASCWQWCLLPVGSTQLETLFAPVCRDIQTAGAIFLAETRMFDETHFPDRQQHFCLCIDLIEVCVDLFFDVPLTAYFCHYIVSV